MKSGEDELDDATFPEIVFFFLTDHEHWPDLNEITKVCHRLHHNLLYRAQIWALEYRKWRAKGFVGHRPSARADEVMVVNKGGKKTSCFENEKNI